MLFKKLFLNSFVACLCLVCLGFGLHTTTDIKKTPTNISFSKLKEGDIIFQISQSGQGKAIQLATHSKFTHCGIVMKEDGNWFVYEAVQPVKKTLLTEWITHGEKNAFFVKRLKDQAKLLTPEVINSMKRDFTSYQGKNYDLYFGWSDEKIYCSELVWKLYKQTTGIELGALQQLKEFDLSNPIVQLKLKERYKDSIPYHEMVISPSAIYDSKELISVE